MDIRDWPMDRIMALPDCCFGRRWPIGLGAEGDAVETVYNIAESALPDIFVLWEIAMVVTASFTAFVQFEIRLGDQLPVVAADFEAMELLLPGVQNSAGVRSAYTLIGTINRAIRGLRVPVKAQGRRLVVAYSALVEGAWAAEIDFVVSSVPKEVPDWLCSV